MNVRVPGSKHISIRAEQLRKIISTPAKSPKTMLCVTAVLGNIWWVARRSDKFGFMHHSILDIISMLLQRMGVSTNRSALVSQASKTTTF